MAKEQVNWKDFYDQGVVGKEPFNWRVQQRVNRERERLLDLASNIPNHPLVSKVRTFSTPIAKNWWDNTNPKKFGEKDLIWKISAGIGVVESAAVIFLIPGTGWIKGIVNTGLTQGLYFGGRRIYNYQKGRIISNYTGLNQRTRLHDLENNHKKWENVVKNITGGLAFGGFWLSMPFGIADSLTQHAIRSTINNIHFTNPFAVTNGIPTETPTPRVIETTRVPTKTPTIAPRPIEIPTSIVTPHPSETATPVNVPTQTPIAQETPSAKQIVTPTPKPVSSSIATETTTTQAGSELKLTPEQLAKAISLENDMVFKQTLAAETGLHMSAVDDALKAALKADGLTPNHLTSTQLNNIRNVVQHSLETKVNEAGHLTTQEVIHDRPYVDIHSLDMQDQAQRKIEMHLNDWLSDLKFQESLKNAASQAIHNQGIQGAVAVPTLPVESASQVNDLNPLGTQAPASQPIEPLPTSKPSNVIDFSEKVKHFVEQNKGDHSMIENHTVLPGETAGQTIVDMGGNVSWDGADVNYFIALAEANPNTFFDLHTGLPLTPDVLHELMKQLEDPNPLKRLQAARKLYSYMGGVRAGSHINRFTTMALNKIISLKAA